MTKQLDVDQQSAPAYRQPEIIARQNELQYLKQRHLAKYSQLIEQIQLVKKEAASVEENIINYLHALMASTDHKGDNQ